MYPTVCPVLGCPENLDAFGDHALCCKKGGEATIRHNRLTQRIALECSKAVAGVSLEARLLLQKSDERPADILLTAWRGGALALDVTVPHVRTKRTPESAKGLHAMDLAEGSQVPGPLPGSRSQLFGARFRYLGGCSPADGSVFAGNVQRRQAALALP